MQRLPTEMPDTGQFVAVFMYNDVLRTVTLRWHRGNLERYDVSLGQWVRNRVGYNARVEFYKLEGE